MCIQIGSFYNVDILIIRETLSENQSIERKILYEQYKLCVS